ncbi:ATP-dependent DNA helicase PIF1 [Linum grandiflorum]
MKDNINASLPRSYLWNYCKLLHLTINMRINDLPINNDLIFSGMKFSDWVLSIGTDDPIQDIIAKVYPKFLEAYHSVEYIKSRAIVTPTNAVVSEINDAMLTQIPGPTKTYYSADSLTTTGSNVENLELEYKIEFLNSLSFNRIPEHELKLKEFATVMLLRNLNRAAGLCNDTRILLTNLGDHVLRSIIVGGTMEGTVVVIPRRQYPIRLCYAMTINKSQGQTLEKVGLFLPKLVFAHGQLYVAVSRVRSAKGLHIVLQTHFSKSESTTRNIVYQESLEDLERP